MSIPITDLPGVGPKTADALKQNGIDSVEALIEAGVDKLAEVPGISAAKAATFLEAAKEMQGETGEPEVAPVKEAPAMELPPMDADEEALKRKRKAGKKDKRKKDKKRKKDRIRNKNKDKKKKKKKDKKRKK